MIKAIIFWIRKYLILILEIINSFFILKSNYSMLTIEIAIVTALTFKKLIFVNVEY